jgi:CheY-like chemotaxis protein
MVASAKMSKTALVVDDSPVARHVLCNMLTANGIAADWAESGESALDYLRHQRPDVIFMDHMMPGIDGFQALEAIKANPATATIPVMMYTSQEGELYVGQARALGAFGVLPKSLQPIELNQVLRALRLLPTDRAEQNARQPTPLSADHRAETPEVAALLEDLFRQQRLALSAEIRQTYERVVATREPPKEPLPAEPPPAPRRQAVVRPSVVAVTILGGLAVVFASLYASTTRVLQDTTQRTSNLISSAAQLATVNLNANAAQVPTASGSAKPQGFGASAAPAGGQLAELIEWTLNENNTYGFDEIALGEPRAEKLRRAIEFMASAGLSGRLALRVHVGRFCMTYGADGRAQLAETALPVAQCEQLGWLPSDAFALGRRQTLQFANLVTDVESGTRIRLESDSAGDGEPAVPYPPVTAQLAAGEWNRVAAANHRVDIRFFEEPSGVAAGTAR